MYEEYHFKLRLMRHIKFSSFAISFQSRDYWNKLPNSRKEVTSVAVFRRKLKQHILDNYYKLFQAHVTFPVLRNSKYLLKYSKYKKYVYMF